MKMDTDGDYLMYSVKSKSLTAALERTTLLVQALSQERVHDIQYFVTPKNKHEFLVYVS